MIISEFEYWDAFFKKRTIFIKMGRFQDNIGTFLNLIVKTLTDFIVKKASIFIIYLQINLKIS